MSSSLYSSTLAAKLIDNKNQCQQYYNGKAELATEDDEKIASLCFLLEQILSHGLRNKLYKSSKLDLSEFIREFTTSNNTRLEFWTCVSYILPRSERERFLSLKFICTDLGRGRAWLRSSLNEHSFERYIKCLVGEKDVLEQFYDTSAFLRDESKQSILLKCAADLSSIVFVLNIDIPELNNKPDDGASINRYLEPIIQANDNVEVIQTRKKKTAQNIISFDDNSNISKVHKQTVIKTDGNLNIVNANETTPINIKTNLDVSSHVLSSSADSNKTLEEMDAYLKSSDESLDVVRDVMSVSGYSESRSLSDLNTDNESESSYSTAASNDFSSLRILGDNGIGELIPITSYIPTNASEALDSDERAVDALYENGVDDLEDSLSICSTSDGGSSAHHSSHQIIRKSVHDQKCKGYEDKIQELNRENELLKHQLRKYVTAVQLLKKEQDEVPIENEAHLYEQKLVQLAEMHSELLELNQSLKFILNTREDTIEKLNTEVMALRGYKPSLVSMWLPCVFLGGTPSDPHHIYQIHMRIGTEEWNVYRRYSDFYKFNKDIRKRYPSKIKLLNVKFPPKNLIFNKGNKNAIFVEDRRQKLEIYLRQIVNCIVEYEHNESKLNKFVLVTLIPFLNDFYKSTMCSKSKTVSNVSAIKRLSTSCMKNTDTSNDGTHSLEYNGL